MNPIRVIALVLIIAGVVGLAYGGFSFTRNEHKAQIGPIDLSVSKQENFNVPTWAGVGAIVIGVGMLLVGRKR